MAWFILIAVMLFLYGSFLMVRPSARQKQVAFLRQFAIENHLEIRLASRMKFPEELSRVDMACLLCQRPEGKAGGSGSVFRNPETGKIRAYGVFSALDSQAEEIFRSLPAGAEALISSDSYVGVCWDEKGDSASVEAIASSMDSIQRLTAVS